MPTVKIKNVTSGECFTTVKRAQQYVNSGQAIWLNKPNGKHAIEFIGTAAMQRTRIRSSWGAVEQALKTDLAHSGPVLAMDRPGRPLGRFQQPKHWQEAKVWFRVGSAFKGCRNCGMVTEWDTFRSGFDIFRSYQPKWTGWTYKCFSCGSTDGDCWANATDIGEEPKLFPHYQRGGKNKRRSL
jgi:hypothetical protein